MIDLGLKRNGGPTRNHALPFGSLAVDWARSADGIATPTSGEDQRGDSRNANGSQSLPVGDRKCDLGAVERQIGERVVSTREWSVLFDASISGISKNTTSFGLLTDGSVRLTFSTNESMARYRVIRTSDSSSAAASRSLTKTQGAKYVTHSVSNT